MYKFKQTDMDGLIDNLIERVITKNKMNKDNITRNTKKILQTGVVQM